jgi:HTH-type transcriptional regulator / antitoxin HipB
VPTNLPAARLPIVSVADLGKLIRAKRTSLGVTQAETAGLSGVGVRFLSELERGKESVELGKVLRVLNALGLDLWAHARGGNGKA